MKEKTTDVGVIIGRFQIHQLHSEHLKLVNFVLENHNKVIILLGTTTAIGTKKNPLDFITRKEMLEDVFGTKISAILPLPDQRSDIVWSKQVDHKIMEIFPMMSTRSITLYGSRDSFIPYYKGAFKTCQLEPDTYISATDIRETISKQTLRSSDFRAGVIYSVYNQYPTVFSTVDIIIRKEEEILLGRKADENKWRFIGGFVDTTDSSDIQACKREAKEETGLELDDFKFVTSMKISDWRYKGVTDRSIMTRLYECKYIFGAPQPMDDIAELKWFKISEVFEDLIVTEHWNMFKIWQDGSTKI